MTDRILTPSEYLRHVEALDQATVALRGHALAQLPAAPSDERRELLRVDALVKVRYAYGLNVGQRS